MQTVRRFFRRNEGHSLADMVKPDNTPNPAASHEEPVDLRNVIMPPRLPPSQTSGATESLLNQASLTQPRAVINIIYKSKEYSILSNFAKTPFEIGLSSAFSEDTHHVRFGSAEAFIQAIKFPPPGRNVSISAEEDRAHFMAHLGISTLHEYEQFWSKMAGSSVTDARDYRSISHGARERIQEHDFQFLYIMGQRINYESPLRLLAIEEALRQKFTQNRVARVKLLETGDAMLVHEVPNSNVHQTILSPQEFCTILEKLRDEFLKAGKK